MRKEKNQVLSSLRSNKITEPRTFIFSMNNIFCNTLLINNCTVHTFIKLQ
jgi:hypothetical protein